ncbi:MAG: YlxR family protein [Demequinaceae bacterium]|nr:YlxR family protein [Demequinaceae bacterium]
MKPDLSSESSARPQGSQPVRTCVGCRSREARSVLVRVVWVVDRVAVDESASAPGRGAWLHPHGTCLAHAAKRRAIGRALRTTEAGVEALAEHRAFRED